jgi:hypothetical protein
MYCYDLPKIMIKAVEKAANQAQGKPTGAQVATAFKNLGSVDTLLGKVSESPRGFFGAPPTLLYYQNGTPRVVSLEELKALKGAR